MQELLSMERPAVRLSSGRLHELEREELERLASMLPWYLHRLVRLPWVFVYRREYWGGRFYLRGPDSWAARALSILLGGRVSSEKRILTVDEMGRLLRSFKTLIIVVIEATVEAGAKAAHHEVLGD